MIDSDDPALDRRYFEITASGRETFAAAAFVLLHALMHTTTGVNGC